MQYEPQLLEVKHRNAEIVGYKKKSLIFFKEFVHKKNTITRYTDYCKIEVTGTYSEPDSKILWISQLQSSIQNQLL